MLKSSLGVKEPAERGMCYAPFISGTLMQHRYEAAASLTSPHCQPVTDNFLCQASPCGRKPTFPVCAVLHPIVPQTHAHIELSGAEAQTVTEGFCKSSTKEHVRFGCT